MGYGGIILKQDPDNINKYITITSLHLVQFRYLKK
jgi:hypothetical protein